MFIVQCFIQVLIFIASRLLLVTPQIIKIRLCRNCRSARIRTFSTGVEYRKKSEIDDFDAYEAIFAKNRGTKLVLNFEIIIDDARFLP